MDKCFRVVNRNGAPLATGRKVSGTTIVLGLVAVLALAALITGGTHAAMGVLIAVGAAVAVDRLFFGVWK